MFFLSLYPDNGLVVLSVLNNGCGRLCTHSDIPKHKIIYKFGINGK